MSILCQKDGILTTVQDLGRPGFRRLGIGPGGVMDRTAARLLNVLVGSEEAAAVLELHFPAGEYRFESDALFAVGGGDFGPEVDGLPVQNWKLNFVRAGSELAFRRKNKGNRAYLAVGGGFRVADWLGSASTHLIAKAGGLNGLPLRRGDRVEMPSDNAAEPSTKPMIARTLIPAYSGFPTVRIMPGAEFPLLTEKSKRTFREEGFTITNESNRTGYRLNGEPLALRKKVEMISSAVGFGTIQLLPDGQLIILMADHQTTGGYPRVGHVISRDLPLLAQLGTNDSLAFGLVTVADAEVAALEFENNFNIFKVGMSLVRI